MSRRLLGEGAALRDRIMHVLLDAIADGRVTMLGVSRRSGIPRSKLYLMKDGGRVSFDDWCAVAAAAAVGLSIGVIPAGNADRPDMAVAPAPAHGTWSTWSNRLAAIRRNAETARVARIAAVLSDRAAGTPISTMAKRHGLSRAGVSKIISRSRRMESAA